MTVSPRGWHAAADSAWAPASAAAVTSQHQRPRFRERGPSLTGGSAAAGAAASEAPSTATPALAHVQASYSQDAEAAKTALAGRLPAAPLLLLIIAAAFSAGYAVGGRREARSLAELRELTAAELAAQQLASQAAQHAAQLQHAASAPVLRPAPGAHERVQPSAAADDSADDACGQHGGKSALLGNNRLKQGAVSGGGHDASADEDQDGERHLGDGERHLGDAAYVAALHAVSASSQGASSARGLPHPVSGLISLAEAAPGCENSLDTQESSGSVSGSVGFSVKTDTATALHPDHDMGELSVRTDRSAEMRTEADCPDIPTQQSAAASAVLRDGQNDVAPSASDSAAQLRDSVEQQALSAPMRHLRRGQNTAEAFATADEHATAGGATEQVGHAVKTGGMACMLASLTTCDCPIVRHNMPPNQGRLGPRPMRVSWPVLRCASEVP